MIDTFFAMELWTFITFVGAAVALYLTPGADMMFTIASGVSGGPRAGLAAAAGISMGVLVHIIIAAAGLAVLIAASPVTLDIIRYAGAVYLLVLAWQNWHDTDNPAERRGRADIGRAFRRGFVTNILNPKVALFILAFLPQFADPAIGPVWQQIIILGIVLAIGGFIIDGVIGVFSGVLAEKISERTQVMNKISAVIFAGLAIRLAWK